MLTNGKYAPLVRFALLWVLIPNITFILIQQAYAIGRAPNILLYSGIGLLWPLLGSIVAVPLYGVIYIADLLATICEVFGIPRTDLLGAIPDVIHLDLLAHWPYLLLGLTALVGLVLPLAMGWRVERRARHVPLGLALLLALSAAVMDVAANTDLRYGARFAGYQYFSHFFDSPDRVPASALRTAGLHERLDAGTGGRSLLVVVVEALGRFKDEALNQQLAGVLLDDAVSARYEVRSGAVIYDGSTTRAELRELCDRNDSYLSYRKSLPDGVSCLPAELAAKGYRTTAVHGFTGRFFDRTAWYPVIGFEKAVFFEQMADAPLCGWVFPGACERRVAEVVREELAAASPTQPALVYWLTLNSHVPVVPDSSGGAPFDCTNIEDATACTIARLWAEVFAAVRGMALDPALPPMDVLIVGDHAPPLTSRRARALFERERVPWIALVRRD